ncbi:MAG: chemotaxis protein CheA [gamma proteobacterium symbiont of Ctena orbiculata]|nr:chemotaxis protein CheA [Candidatus Thiodiazotropha taylori]PUB89164.1 MAG: chemotaxis protein CheA [gamma proteobacterium symbiont of Ctena orbiculata]MBT2998589.1 chemotaxis protein CheA [Candidatus Thiodiazotropha taylori]MBT3027298.1 chemotaxis protein CheA [Candidatus Thiodiazotropha taylori]MBT3034932.1 chemotaxis protein CheA [Candidatus Thiodiazotropha taylori]
MSIDVNDEILQDFLVEAGEILELLSEQLVDLEQQPDDFDLLNAVFRGFHTIKGGAGFLAIEPLVEVCHRAEDVFNILRQGQRSVGPDLMDSVLEVLDVVNAMFEQVREGIMPENAERDLIERLNRFAVPEGEDEESESEGEAEPAVAEAEPAVAEAAVEPEEPVNQAMQSSAADAAPESGSAAKDDLSDNEFENLLDAIQEPDSGGKDDNITEDEFEALLDELHGEGKFTGAPKQETEQQKHKQGKSAASDDITEDEFDALLDEIHGEGKFDPAKLNKEKTPAKKAAKKSKPAAADDEITEDEFDALLDEIHGAGKFDPNKLQKGDGSQQGAANQSAHVPTDKRAAKPAAKAASKPKSKPKTEAKPKPAAADSKAKKAPAAAPKQAKAAANKPAAETSVRVDTQRLDDIMNMVGELVLVRNRLATLKATMNDEDVANAVSNLDVVTSDLQLAVMKTRMQPIKKVFGRFPRVVRDLARSLKKEIDLEMVGEETDLDKNLVEALADPLVHLVRNSVDHGIELPDDREAKGKPRRGRVVLSAAQEGDHILLSIADDGKGMDPEVLRKKAVEKGMMDTEAAARLDDKECFNLIFAPGFSTKTEISDVSGRGVGMDVVKTRIAQMNGSVEIDSEWGEGSLITIKLPLTLAILPTLMVVLGEQPFALPLASVVEIFNLNLKRTNVVDGQLTIMVRERALPLFYLRNWLIPDKPLDDDEKAKGHVVIVNVGNIQVGLVVDHLIGQEEVVIKPLGALLQGLDGMAGATITGDGKIALIMDVPGLMRKYAKKF